MGLGGLPGRPGTPALGRGKPRCCSPRVTAASGGGCSPGCTAPGPKLAHGRHERPPGSGLPWPAPHLAENWVGPARCLPSPQQS